MSSNCVGWADTQGFDGDNKAVDTAATEWKKQCFLFLYSLVWNRETLNIIKTRKQDATLPIKGKGTFQLTWGNKFVPEIVINLIRAGELDSKGCVLQPEKSKLSVSKEGQVALKGVIKNVENHSGYLAGFPRSAKR
ncbi:hypothetical protein VP01_2293g3 [Puccinia sorghi]|uniref:Uncharacterized protein n=1 Tax=Puccinia sorghi TaxID=27349 RepID=A0A0L6V819_9BASI|nr:hypothetical protein VP01_2293g3 [Puccinia sorghi]